jgi:nicotinate-nucleotide pyrophosphorylase (carboxylating)
VHAGARFVVCDGMRPEQLLATVRQIRTATSERVEIAASGAFDLDSAQDVARTGVDHLYVDSLVQDSTVLQIGLTIA